MRKLTYALCFASAAAFVAAFTVAEHRHHSVIAIAAATGCAVAVCVTALATLHWK